MTNNPSGHVELGNEMRVLHVRTFTPIKTVSGWRAYPPVRLCRTWWHLDSFSPTMPQSSCGGSSPIPSSAGVAWSRFRRPAAACSFAPSGRTQPRWPAPGPEGALFLLCMQQDFLVIGKVTRSLFARKFSHGLFKARHCHDIINTSFATTTRGNVVAELGLDDGCNIRQAWGRVHDILQFPDIFHSNIF